MVQLTINGVDYPKTSRDKYRCYWKDLGESLRMANGRMVFERRGQVQVIEYTYDYFDDAMRMACLAELRSGNVLQVNYLSPEGDTLSGQFRCTRFPQPTFAFCRGDKPYWHNYEFTLEGVEPL